jgi:RNA polymerase sigma-70 factor (ECF subfamily)
MSAQQTFEAQRSVLFGIAYRMLGSIADAEDMLQDAWLRWERTDREAVENPRAWLVTVVTRLCLDHLRSARVRREQYVGPWLPEPLLTEGDTSDDMARAESVSLAFLVVLDTLSPAERAVFLLREVFEYDYAEIAGIVARSEAACRQLAHRAREHVAARRPRYATDPARKEEVTARFLAACAGGDLEGLVALLADDVAVYTDGGGKAKAARRPIIGGMRAARYLIGITAEAGPGLEGRITSINGGPGVVIERSGEVLAVMDLEILQTRVHAVRIVVNPEKLRLREGAGMSTEGTEGTDGPREQIHEGSGKQYGEGPADLAEDRDRDLVDRDLGDAGVPGGINPGSGKQFREDAEVIEAQEPDEIPAGSGKQFAPGHEGDPDLPPPESGKGFAQGQADEDV